MAALSRIANGDHRASHRSCPAIRSSSRPRPIPGNETSVRRIINNLFRQGANVIYSALTTVHVSGHASQEELKLMLNLTRPRYVMPLHGEQRHLVLYARLAEQMGVPPERIFARQRQRASSRRRLGAPSWTTCRRAMSSWTASASARSARWSFATASSLSRDGMLIVVVTVDKQTGAAARRPGHRLTRLRSRAERRESSTHRKNACAPAFEASNGRQRPQRRLEFPQPQDQGRRQRRMEQTRRRPMVLPMVMEA